MPLGAYQEICWPGVPREPGVRAPAVRKCQPHTVAATEEEARNLGHQGPGIPQLCLLPAFPTDTLSHPGVGLRLAPPSYRVTPSSSPSELHLPRPHLQHGHGQPWRTRVVHDTCPSGSPMGQNVPGSGTMGRVGPCLGRGGCGHPVSPRCSVSAWGAQPSRS